MIIYVLKDPSNGEVRYVGKTVKTIQHRLCAHICPSALKTRNHRSNWIKSVLASGAVPIIEEVARAENQTDLAKLEQACIAFGRAIGMRLTNTTDGGEGLVGYRHSPETRLKLSKSHVGLPPRSEESERKRKAAVAEALRRPEVRLRRSLATKGRRRDPRLVAMTALGNQKFIQASDGRVFRGLREAALALGVNPATVDRAIHRRKKTCLDKLELCFVSKEVASGV